MEELLRMAQEILGTEYTLLQVGINFLASICLSSALAAMYFFAHPHRKDRIVLVQSLILLSFTIAAAMMIIGNSLARAFGLVGAVSIVRFRTAIKNPKDMAYVFMTIVIGMGSGLGLWVVALVFTVIGVLILMLIESPMVIRKGSHHRNWHLETRWTQLPTEESILEMMQNMGVSHHLVSSGNSGEKISLSYQIKLTNGKTQQDLVRIMEEHRQKLEGLLSWKLKEN